MSSNPNSEAPASNKPEQKKEDNERALPKWLLPIATEITAGSIVGFCTGYFCRQASKVVAFVCGGAFIFLQLLSISGYINVNWHKIENDISKGLDADNDGKLTKNDFVVISKKFMRFLTFRLPSAASFSAGFYVGFKGKLL